MIAVEETKLEALDGLRPYPANARAGNIELIQESLRAHGQYRPLIVNRPTREVLAGNHLLHALLAEGYTQGLVSWVDVDALTARKINLVDNRTADVGTYDNAALWALIQKLDGDLTGTGFDDYTLNALLEEVAKPGGPLNAESTDLRWGKQAAPMTPDELTSMLVAYRLYREQEKTDVGFGFWLIGDRA